MIICFIRRKKRSLEVVLSVLGGLATIAGLVAYIVKISMDYAKVKAEQIKLQEKIVEVESEYKEEIAEVTETIEQVKNDFEESFSGVKKYYSEQYKSLKESNSEKFKELYQSRNKTEVCLAELTSTVKMLVQNMDKQFSTIEKKIDDLSKKMGES